ncbi:MAG: phosphatase [Clostridia bacterium]|nr:phosphatase [Clostridia bacterium]
MESKKLDDAKIAQREYMRRWRAENPEKVRAAQARYWNKKGAEMRAAARNGKTGGKA